jgi:hypothetical protein
LAANKKITEALRIIKVFIDDPDPQTQSKEIEDGKSYRAITTVRGWCGWALMHCAVIEGREHLSEVIHLTEKLINDGNYLVVHLACFALAQLVKNRLTVMPDNFNILFFNDDVNAALKMSKRLEAIAFNLLDRFDNWPPLVQEAMFESILKVFNSILSLKDTDVLKLIKVFEKKSNHAIGEFLPLLLYYAEFRKNAYRNWRFALPGLYDDIVAVQYDDEELRRQLFSLIERIQKDNPKNCLKFISALEGGINALSRSENPEKSEEAIKKYVDLMVNVYDDSIYHGVYRIIENRLKSESLYQTSWFELFMKCLNVEKQYRADISAPISAANYSTNILLLIFNKMGSSKFIDAAEIIFSYAIMISNEEKIFEILEGLVKNNDPTKNKALKIIKSLADKQPIKYRAKYQDLMKLL